MRAAQYVRRGLLAIVALVAALSLAVVPAGAQEEPPPEAEAVVCTIWLPPSGYGCQFLASFQPGTSYGAMYNDIGWYDSPSWARRTSAGVSIWGSCLPNDAQFVIRYRRQNGTILDSQGSPYGACGFAWNRDSNGEYVKVEVRLHRDCGEPCPNTMYAWVGGWSYWY